MMGRGSLWLPLAILVVLAVLSFWIERVVRVVPGRTPAVQTDPEGIMENFDALRTDAFGRPHHRLSAKKLKHYTGSQLTELDAPRFAQLDAESGEVTATARRATVSADGDQVDLQGDVELVRAGQAGKSPLSLRTARLLVFLEQDRMRAPGPVDVRDNALTLHAGAMQYDAKRQLITLTGRVKARYLSGRT
jgi:lipopolysaccharide export system protein LptC